MEQYFLSNGQDQRGPFTLGDLIGRGLSPTTLVWTEGMEDWQEAAAVPAVQPLLAIRRASPPAPPHAASSGGDSSKSPRHSSPLSAQRPLSGGNGLPKRIWAFLGGGVGVIMLGLVAFGLSRNNEVLRVRAVALRQASTNDSTIAVNVALKAHQASEKKANEAVKLQQQRKQQQWNRAHFMDYISTSVMPGYEVGMFGGISRGRIQLVNNSGYRIENAVVAVRYITSGGSVYKIEYVGIDHLAAHESILQPVPDCVRGVRLDCSVYRLSAPGLSYDSDRDQGTKAIAVRDSAAY